MRTLTVRYRETGRKIIHASMTGFVLHGADQFSALIVEDGYMHPIRFDQVELAFDPNTGEVFSLRELCGAPPLPGPQFSLQRPQSRPKGRKRSGEPKNNKQAKRADREAFLERFRYEVIWNHYRNKLIAQFQGRCFACGSPDSLQLDHHVPFSKGGRREPGNIVMLCYRCNAQKCDYTPSEYYSDDELSFLAVLLEQQHEVLGFVFREDRWLAEPLSYLREIGISPLLIEEVSTNPDHDWTLVPTLERRRDPHHGSFGVIISAELP